jgi:hypothetical protein
MISWRDAFSLSRKRWKRKRIFGSLKYSAPLFLLTLLTIITMNVTYSMLDRVRVVSYDSKFPHPTHLRISVPPKSETPITPAQIKALRDHPAVLHVMTAQTWLSNIYADFGEVRYASIPYFCGYTKEFFELYRTLPPEKIDPTCVPVLLGRDLLSLSWSPEQQRFARNEKEEIRRWLGRSFSIYLNPWGTESTPTALTADQLDYTRYRKSIMDKRKKHLEELERKNPELARIQDALTVKLQVVGFVWDRTENGMTSVLPEEVARQILELSALRRGNNPNAKKDDSTNNVNLIIKPGQEQAVKDLAASLGLNVYDRSSDGSMGRLFKIIRDDPETSITLYVIMSLYSLAMLVIIYQLLSGQVKDSIREIGLLRCIGARRRDIMRIFIVMNLVRLTRIYLFCLVAAYALLSGFGYWFADKLNLINPESLINGSIPDYLIYKIDHFSTFWLIGPPWMVVMPLVFLLPIALGSAIVPILHVMGVQPSEALKD